MNRMVRVELRERAGPAEAPRTRDVRAWREGEVGFIQLDRPESSNALTPEMLGELLETLAWIAGARALVLTGAGRAFSAGGDLTTVHAALTEPAGPRLDEVDRALALLGEVVLAVGRLRCPVVAAVNGQAAGAGFSLALACDVRIASRRAVFNFAYGALGASPDGGMTYLLPRVVSPARATELLMEQPMIRATRALEEGLVSAVVEPDELLDAARARAQRLAGKAPHALLAARALVGDSFDRTFADHLRREREVFVAGLETDDIRSGFEAFFAGERPVFHGR
jgi:enoyl-CoA hydratase/carnithine racemase